MAVVMEFKTALGVTVRVHDDEYVNASPEEIARRWREVGNQILRIDEKIQMERLRREQSQVAD